MSSPRALDLQATSSQLSAALDAYERQVAEMIDAWPELERYRNVSAQVENIRLYSSGLPELRVQWVELLIAHAELIHFLWRTEYGDRAAARQEIGTVRDHHANCVAALRKRCQRIEGRS